MQLTPAQEAAVNAAIMWSRGDDPEFVLAGFAGTGKTTIVRDLVEKLEGRVLCVAPTGKAASVLKSKLPDGAQVSTIHAFIYSPVEVDEERVSECEMELAIAKQRGDQREAARLAERVERLRAMFGKGQCEFAYAGPNADVDFVIADEASMIDERMEADLRRTEKRLIFVGDSGQLPPVQGRSFFERNRPDAVLTEIHRQAADNPILRLATAVRECKRFDDWDQDRCRLVRGMKNASVRMLLGADKVITGKNHTRRALNLKMRRALFPDAKLSEPSEWLGYSELPLPVAGEQLICLRNEAGLGLINGVPAWAKGNAEILGRGHVLVELTKSPGGETIYYPDFEHAEDKRLLIDDLAFQHYVIPDARRPHPPEGSEWDFGHAITVHKAQGSEWPSVLVWDDGFLWSGSTRSANRRRWVYTAATRAAERLVWVDARPGKG